LACTATLSGLFRPPVGRPVAGPAAAGAGEGPCDPSQWAGGPDAEAPAPPVRPMDRERSSGPKAIPHARPHWPCVSSPTEAKASDATSYEVGESVARSTRTRRFQPIRGADVPTTFVDSPLNPSRDPSSPLGVEPPVKVTWRKVPARSPPCSRIGRRIFATPTSFSRASGKREAERGKPRESIGRSFNPLGAPCRSHSGPKAGLFPATEEPSRTLRPASGSPPLQ
jgi:hypothetical protein